MALVLAASACSKVERGAPTADTSMKSSVSQAEPSDGRWQTWVLTSGDQIPVPPPPAASSPQAKVEDQELRDAVGQRSQARPRT